MNASDLNQQLRDLYVEQLPNINEIVGQYANEKQMLYMSGPFMMYVHPEYVSSSKKLMFVGMETHTWERYALNEELFATHQRLTHRYQEFTTTNEHPNSPFWWFIKGLSEAYSQTNYTKSALWTNLSKIDIEGKRPTGRVYNNTMQRFLDILIQEVSIVKPDVLVLMTTNPHYQWHLNERLGLAAGLSIREPLIPKQLFKWVTDLLPVNTFQIYHPNRLRFTLGGYKSNADRIIQVIVGQSQEL